MIMLTCSCSCVDGYDGYFCSRQKNDCVTSSSGGDVCLNDANCTDEHLGFTCTCADGFTGS